MAEQSPRYTYRILPLLVVLGWTVDVPLANAETVEVPAGQQAAAKQDVERPSAGMQQDRVREQYGEPADWHEAVGDPPISTWIYPDFVVYFEYDRVLHTVLRGNEEPLSPTSE